MPRLYYPRESIRGQHIFINQRKQIHYLCDVLRLEVNDDVFVFDGKAHEYHCQIQEASKQGIKLLIKEEVKMKSRRNINLTIACALPRQSSRFDDLVDKLSQLNVYRIIPMITERVIVRWDAKQRQRHYQRWQRIAQQACIQSGRNILPIIEPIKQMNQILTNLESYELKLIPTLMGRRKNLKDIISDSLPKSSLILIGPEGDFTKQELTQAENAGSSPVFLGDLVLRVDTAAIAIAAFLRLYERCKG